MSQKTASPAPTYMFLFRQPADAPAGTPEQMQAHFQKWMEWIGSMRAKGQYLAGEPLEEQPGRVLRGPRGAKASDGPFAEAKEVVGGFMIIKAQSLAEASAIAKDCPGLEVGGSVEIRQVMPVPM
ncbi:MAG: hypothetical protein RLZZ15_3461 [Verrucomicrobiota bacterium]|jgi:hypothetical protein